VTTPSFSTLDFSVAEGIATITFNRPESHNSMTVAMCHDMHDAMDLADGDDDIRVVIVTGAGSNFCVGADLDEGFISSEGRLSDATLAYLERAGQINGVPRDGGGFISLRIAQSLKPVIGAIRGAAVGVGITMTLPMDIRIVSDDARAGFVFARRGLVPEAASSWFLPRIVGISKAMEWVATGRLIDADEMTASGLASYCVPRDDVLIKAQEIARQIADNTSGVAVAASRQLMWGMLGRSSPWDAHALDSRLVYDLAGQGDVKEGVQAFLEKRPARFPLTVSNDLPAYLSNWASAPT